MAAGDAVIAYDYMDMYRPSRAPEVAARAWQAFCTHDPAWRCATDAKPSYLSVRGDAPDCWISIDGGPKLSISDPSRTTLETAEIYCGVHRYKVHRWAHHGPRESVLFEIEE